MRSSINFKGVDQPDETSQSQDSNQRKAVGDALNKVHFSLFRLASKLAVNSR